MTKLPSKSRTAVHARAVGSLLAALRRRAGWNVATLARKAKISEATLIRYELGERLPRLDLAFSLVKVLGNTGKERVEILLRLALAMGYDFLAKGKGGLKK